MTVVCGELGNAAPPANDFQMSLQRSDVLRRTAFTLVKHDSGLKGSYLRLLVVPDKGVDRISHLLNKVVGRAGRRAESRAQLFGEANGPIGAHCLEVKLCDGSLCLPGPEFEKQHVRRPVTKHAHL